MNRNRIGTMFSFVAVMALICAQSALAQDRGSVAGQVGVTFQAETALVLAGEVSGQVLPMLQIYGTVGRMQDTLPSELQDLIDFVDSRLDFSIPTVYGIGGVRAVAPAGPIRPYGVFGAGFARLSGAIKFDGEDVTEEFVDLEARLGNLEATAARLRTFLDESRTVEEALAHPTWNMGRKITIDSATLMNKALEIIEARWLFDLRADQIEVVIHPQSIVHSLVEFVDGSVVAQLSPPDMRLPIQYALSYPDRWPSEARKLDWAQQISFSFFPPDFARFPALKLGLDVAAQGGTAGAVLSAGNEAAVSAFLAGELQFSDIVRACRRVLARHPFDPSPTLEKLFELDQWARGEVLCPAAR